MSWVWKKLYDPDDNGYCKPKVECTHKQPSPPTPKPMSSLEDAAPEGFKPTVPLYI